MLDNTVLLFVMAWSSVLLLVSTLVGLRRRGNGLGTWVAALAAHAAGGVLLGLRGRVPDVASILLGNAGIFAAALLFGASLAQFYGRAVKAVWVLAPTALFMLALALNLDSFLARVRFTSVAVALAALTPEFVLLRLGRGQRSPAQWLVFAGFSLAVGMMVSRSIVAFAMPETMGQNLSQGTSVQNITYIVGNGYLLLVTIGCLFMHKERAEVELAREREALRELNATLELRVSEQVDVIVKRSREIEKLNAELRQQVTVRSVELVTALAELANRQGDGLLTIGTRLANRYSIEALLGRGGMGVVYRARDAVTAEHVALKVIAARSAGEVDSLLRLVREAQASTMVVHPAIVQTRHVDVADDQLFLVFELIEGASLDRVMRARGPIDAASAMALTAHVAEALAAAHAVGIVHRDIKPANVMLTRQGGVKLLDFGISKLRQAAHEEGDLTRNGALLGTPGYMAPEQIVDPASATDRSDVYALGVILYELVCGQRPFDGEPVGAMMMSRLNNDAPALSSRAPGTPPPLDRLVSRCLARAAAERPIMAEVAAELAALVASQGEVAPPLLDADTEARIAIQTSAAGATNPAFEGDATM